MYFEVIMGISLHISSLSPLFFSSLAFLRYKEHCFFIMDFKIIASLKKKTTTTAIETNAIRRKYLNINEKQQMGDFLTH